MYKKIMVGLDGSEHSLEAARKAIDLAKKYDAELHLMTVTKEYKVSDSLRRYLEAENLMGSPKYVMGEMTHEICEHAVALAREAEVSEIKTAVREGKPARGILSYAKSNKIDLIVLGCRGVGEFEAALLGSVSQKVSLLSDCTVMIVR